MLTLEKFEQASEIVKDVTLPTKLVYSEYLSQQSGGRDLSEAGEYAEDRRVQSAGRLL